MASIAYGISANYRTAACFTHYPGLPQYSPQPSTSYVQSFTLNVVEWLGWNPAANSTTLQASQFCVRVIWMSEISQQPQPAAVIAVSASAAAAADKIGEIIRRHERDLTMVKNLEFRGFCESCNEPVFGTDGVSYKYDNLSRYFHSKCFKCHLCAVNLREGGRSSEFFLHDGNPHCVPCYQSKILGCCDTCGLVLDSQKGVVRARGGKKFHPECFVCKKCETRLDGRYYEKDDGF
ncbi:hypothetical protein BC830DRAFT_504969 [Chytriomyces sp. MP71]|nr:hypothetical protein BC830DRAFT_504969 [Chytriomyces sp. MP71]